LSTEPENSAMDEAQRVRRAQDGDRDAFAELVRLYQRRTVSVAYRLLGNIDDATDVSQDAFVRAYRSLGQLDDPARFGGWLMRIVTNLSLNYRRSRKLRAAGPIDDVLATSNEVRSPSGVKRVSTGLEDPNAPLPKELSTAISKAMEQLPDKQRLALVLFSIEGMPQKEVAEVLKCSIELVKWNVFQARKKLKELLEPFLT
jgi:RNA polymerase sigma-70 factor (ECF subfamily)